MALWGQVMDRLNLISGVNFALVGWAIYSHYNIFSQPFPSQHPTAGKGGCGWSFLSEDPSSALASFPWAPGATGALQTLLSSEAAFCHHRSLDPTSELARIPGGDT